MSTTTKTETGTKEESKVQVAFANVQQTADQAVLSLEGIALQHGMMPVTLLRESCSPEAEKLVRKLGRLPQSAEPWLPVTAVGPVLVMAHHNPKATDLWGVPAPFTICVIITTQQYQRTRQDLVQRFTADPIPGKNNFEHLQCPSFKEMGIQDSFEWLLKCFPYDAAEASRLKEAYATALEKNPKLGVTEFNTIQRNLGVALAAICGGTKTFTYNAGDAPRQQMFPSHLLERHNVYPLFVGRNTVYLLSDTPDNYAFEDEWLSLGNRQVKMIAVLADTSSIREAIARAVASLDPESVGKIETNISNSDDDNLVDISPEDMGRINPQGLNHTPEEIIHWALFTAIRCRASDLHIEKYYSVTRFRARIDGTMQVILTAPEDLLNRFVALVKNWSNMGQSRQECQDGRFAIRIGARRLDVRVAAVPTRREFQKIVMRFLDKRDGVRRLSDFNLSPRQIDILGRTMQRDQGLVLVTGPTGSGKTTTLYALLNSVNDVSVNIQTIEDPIEYEVEGINQTQTNPVYNLDFANGLRSLLRADPDIILIGESRDAETANAAVNASLTGHLVLTTLHANDSIRAVSRLLSMGVEKYLVADSLAISQAQRLVRRLCNYCKRPVPVPPAVQAMMARNGYAGELLAHNIYEKVGCDECHDAGYSGRVALMELCEINDEIRDHIEQGSPQSMMRAAAMKIGRRHCGIFASESNRFDITQYPGNSGI
ncbi:MAG: GspE/PulE family protein [Verrucomicrobiaceae bacterium]